MPYQMGWYIEKRVIDMQLYGNVTEDEIIRNFEDIEDYISKGEAPLLLLIDTREIITFPPNFKKMLNEMQQYRPENTPVVMTLTISGNQHANFFTVLASKVVGLPLKSFKSVDEVNEFIAHNFPDLLPALENRRKI